MTEIYTTEHFSGRSDDQQELIALIEKHFPESGFPRLVDSSQGYIIIGSSLISLHVGFKHGDFVAEPGAPGYRVCIYQKDSLKFLYMLDSIYPPNDVKILKDYLFIGSGIYGDLPKGNLKALNLDTGEVLDCSDDSRPIGLLKKISPETLEVYTYKATGYYEGQTEIFQISLGDHLFMDYKGKATYTIIEEDHSDLMENNECFSITSETLRNLI